MNLDFMNVSFFYAMVSFYLNEVPIGAVIVKDNQIIACGYNLKEFHHSSLYHAELIAIYEAQKKLNNWRLNDCDIYVTLDPCPMCASAIKQARIRNVYSALENSDTNNSNIIQQIFLKDCVNPSVNYLSNLNVEMSKSILNQFFSLQRGK
ncbi:MAG: nucleoside deaminase [Bacilli bacterium]|nr:nucleoside deaminase [Bacilli bacterium]